MHRFPNHAGAWRPALTAPALWDDGRERHRINRNYFQCFDIKKLPRPVPCVNNPKHTHRRNSMGDASAVDESSVMPGLDVCPRCKFFTRPDAPALFCAHTLLPSAWPALPASSVGKRCCRCVSPRKLFKDDNREGTLPNRSRFSRRRICRADGRMEDCRQQPRSAREPWESKAQNRGTQGRRRRDRTH